MCLTEWLLYFHLVSLGFTRVITRTVIYILTLKLNAKVKFLSLEKQQVSNRCDSYILMCLFARICHRIVMKLL